ncbi:hypothetical protein MTO96_025846 [Rhipicephalus appendiculatus]
MDHPRTDRHYSDRTAPRQSNGYANYDYMQSNPPHYPTSRWSIPLYPASGSSNQYGPNSRPETLPQHQHMGTGLQQSMWGSAESKSFEFSFGPIKIKSTKTTTEWRVPSCGVDDSASHWARSRVNEQSATPLNVFPIARHQQQPSYHPGARQAGTFSWQEASVSNLSATQSYRIAYEDSHSRNFNV